jgi:hypothetical protein
MAQESYINILYAHIPHQQDEDGNTIYFKSGVMI